MKKNGGLLAIVFRLWKKSSKAKKTDEKPTPVSEELEEVSETMRVKEVCGRTSDSELGANEGEGADLVSTGSAAIATAPSMPRRVGGLSA